MNQGPKLSRRDDGTYEVEPEPLRVVVNGESRLVDLDTAYHLLSNGLGELADATDRSTLEALREIGEARLARQARNLRADGLLL